MPLLSVTGDAGIGVCWPDDLRRLRSIATARSIPCYCYPHKVQPVGSELSLVAPDGRVLLRCKVRDVLGPKRVLTANGKVREHGYEFLAVPSSVKFGQDRRLGRIQFSYMAVGQLFYYDRHSKTQAIADPSRRSGLEGVAMSTSRPAGVELLPLGSLPGRILSRPEHRLVESYVSWIGEREQFKHAQLLENGTITDLFCTSVWTLFEAKSSSTDPKVREAFGQLYDYKRHFPRRPSTALLLPDKPRARALEFLEHFRVGAVWRTSGGAFQDSVGGKLTSELRSRAQQRSG